MKKILKYNGIEIPHYSVDVEGNVYLTDTGAVMTKHRTHNGYDRVKLSVGIERKLYLVHRLVASTFIENPDNLPVVNHINGIRHDNRVENLEWCNNSHNQKERFKTHKGTKRKPIAMIDRITGNIIRVFDSPIDAKNELGIANQNISKCANGKRNHAGGYGWRYI